MFCRYIPLSSFDQANNIDATEEQICATNIPKEQVYAMNNSSEEQVYTTNSPEEQITATNSPEELCATNIIKDQVYASTNIPHQHSEENRKRARDESSSPDTLSPNYTCIESDPASESVIDLTQDSP